MKRAALMALMAQILASQSKAGAEIINQGAPLFGMPILRDSGSPETFGIWRANSIIDIYKTQVDAMRTISEMDRAASAGSVLTELGIINPENRKLLE